MRQEVPPTQGDSWTEDGYGTLIPALPLGLIAGWCLFWIIDFWVSTISGNPYNGGDDHVGTRMLMGLISAIIVASLFCRRVYRRGVTISIYRKYLIQISKSYSWSIKSAIQTQYPWGVAFILEKTIEQLNALGMAYLPVKMNQSYADGSSTVIGYPDLSKLKAAIKLAQEVSRNWEDITRLGGVSAQIQAVEAIHRLIESEVVWIAGMSPDYKRVDKLYWYSYTEEDCRNGLGRDLPTASTTTDHELGHGKQQSEFKAISQAPGNSRVPITFDEFLECHPSVREFLPLQEQELEYRRYLKLSGASEPSVLRSPNHQGNPGQPSSRQEGDQDVW